MAFEVHVLPDDPQPPPRRGLLQRIRAFLSPAAEGGAGDGRGAAVAAALVFALVAGLLVVDQSALRWAHRAAMVIVAGALGYGLAVWFDRGWMARRAAVAAALGCAGFGLVKWLALDLTVPGLGTLQFRPALSVPEMLLGITALLVLLVLAILEQRR